MIWSPASASCGSPVIGEARQRSVLDLRLDPEEHRALHDEGAVV
jgi:hypothetical protein